MDTIYLLLPLAVILSLVALVMLIWSIRQGQFDDLEGPAHRILFEDDQEMLPSVKAVNPPVPVDPDNKAS